VYYEYSPIFSESKFQQGFYFELVENFLKFFAMSDQI